jgi:23S rRNA (guanosine2251-2'-O)-methyltransferase
VNNRHSHSQKSKAAIPEEQLIMGVHTVQEVLRHARNSILAVYTSVSDSTKKRKHELLEECVKRGIPVHQSSFEALTKMVGSDSHQSFVAHIKPRKFCEIQEFIREKSEAFVVMLDQIFDPQNFGAILRSAECFGADAVVWSKNRGCDLTPLATKASCGASELMPLMRVSNLADSLEKFKKAGYEIIASVADPEAHSIFTIRPAEKTVLIIGSEGEGIQHLLRKKADRLVFIPLSGKIESLNAAQATAILLAWSAEQRSKK